MNTGPSEALPAKAARSASFSASAPLPASMAATLPAGPSWPWPTESGGDPDRFVDLFGHRDQLVEDLGISIARFGVGQTALVGERLVGVANRQLGLDHAGAARGGCLAHLCLSPDGAEHPGAGTDDGYRLAPECVVAERPRCP